MKRSDINHLRRLIAWVDCEVGQSPDDMVKTVQTITAKIGEQNIDDEGKHRLVEAHDKSRNVPKYVRDALTALRKVTQDVGQVVGEAEDQKRIGNSCSLN